MAKAKTENLPNPSYLRERLRYEPETGKLYWRSNSAMPDSWNTRWGGREAFTTVAVNDYRQGDVGNVKFYAHRVIWAMVCDEWPQDQIDHIDHDRGNNRFENLRVVEHADNGRNMKLNRKNTTGMHGVYWRNDCCRWYARITHGGVTRHLGHFLTFEAAAAARKKAEVQFGFHTNHGSDALAASAA
jgi:hypothetical protein